MEGMPHEQSISILTDPGSNFSYISTNFVEKFTLKKESHNESWLFQLAMRTKRRVEHWVKACPI